MNQKLDNEKADAALKRAAQKALYGTREERSGRFTAPKVFISYSHDSPDHKSWVLRLGSDLRSNGVDVTLDQWDLSPGQDISLFMQRGISDSDRVVMVCSKNYVSKAEAGTGGVGFERLIVTAEVVSSIDTKKFIPIIRNSDSSKRTPNFLGPRLHVDFEDEQKHQEKLTELLREIHGVPTNQKPPIGLNPFSGTPVASPQNGRGIGQAGSQLAREKSLDDNWFAQESTNAFAGLKKLNATGSMELRTTALHQLSKSQIELLNAVRQSEIRTFGWPIGILLENRPEFKPRPYEDGIKTEISIGGTDRTSFDYWALRSNGDFYLLQSLFEDTRKSNAVFFDTRIVRVTESLMFIQNLYTKLGLPPETRIQIRVTHGGLKSRTLTSASPNRLVFERMTTSEASSTEVTTILGSMGETRVEDVKNVLEPMFMLFDFMQFGASIYEDIVRNFERGKVA